MDAGTQKNNPDWLNPNVLTDFIDDLRDAGYKIGISQYIAAQDLILALTAQGETLNRPERLKTLLGPIFCSSPAEQEDFQERFDRWIEFVSHTPRATERADVKAQALSKELGKVRRGFRQLIQTLIAIVLTGIFLPILFEQSIKDDSAQVTQSSGTQSSGTQSSATQSSGTQSSATKSSATQPSATTFSATKPNSDFPLDWQISLFCFLLTLCIAFLVWRLWWLWRANLFLQRHGTTEQPELHKISIRDFEQNLFPTIMFIHAAQSLRQRIRIPSHELDVDTTIDATLRQGGWLTPVYGTRQVLPEYLFLINRVSYRDHQAKFMEEMVDRLQHNGVFITSYFFDDDPRICLSYDGTSSPQKLHEIIAKYTQHRLVIVSDTEKLFSTQTGEPEPWVSQMTTWGSRAILTPKPVENWGYQELELARQFIILPATPKGVRVLSQVLHQGSATYVLSEKDQISLPEPLRVRPHYWLERNPPKPEQINAMLNSLQEYLGKDGFYWLSACAVFPELHWNITIYLGNVLKTAEGHCLLEVCSPTNLARLPWFRYGNMPDWLRSVLIATFTHQQKHAIRTALQDLLITAVQGSVGRLQLEVAKKHHSFLPKLADAVLHLLSIRVIKGSPLRDYLFLSVMTGQPKLAIEVSDTFSRLLNVSKHKSLLKIICDHKRNFFGLTAIQVFGIIVTGVLISFFTSHMNSKPTKFSETCSNFNILIPDDKSYVKLQATCRKFGSEPNSTSIHLKQIENDNGQLRINAISEESTFQKTCYNMKVEGSRLFADCEKRNREKVLSSLELKGIFNENGMLKYLQDPN
ncbi:CVNH domain-containing protein [Brasilonema bromeliae]|uniref:Cyanovirin-N domain-containing protein n=1 Tax=Brasilonema bromeliae SPC951 TaxID=385972 RepID=A0ABX1P3B1_9CYAN|nr:CVNH domain-containing protein [Brasilonema bromeliae]NMG18834.1 hypothetical protein [Brasilonema bromeliae SPC951]